MKRVLTIIAMAFILSAWGNAPAPGPGPMGPPGPSVGPVGAGEGGVDCRETDNVPKGQSCGRKRPKKSIIKP